MEKKQISLNKVAVFNLLGPIVLNGLTFLTMPLFTRLLGTANYGQYTNYASFLSILVVFVGFQAAGSIAPSSVRYSGSERDQFFSNIMTAALLSAALIGIIIFFLLEEIAGFIELPAHIVVVLFFHATGQFAVNFAIAKFSYDKQSVLTFAVSVVISLISISLSLLFIYLLPSTVERYESYIYGHAVPYMIVGAWMAVYFLRKGKSYFRGEFWRFALALCAPLILHQLSNTLLHQCDKIMLKKITDEASVGIYGFAVTFANIMNIIWLALNNTFIPFYHDDVRAENKEALRRKTRNYLYLYTSLTIGFIFAMPEVVKLFGAKDFWPSIELIPALVLGIYFVFLYSFPVNFEFYHCKSKMIAVGTCLAAVMNVILNSIMIPYAGMMGAALATLISYVLLWLFHMVIANVVIKEPYHFSNKDCWIYLIAVLTAVVLFYVISDFWYIRWGIFLIIAILLLMKVKKQKSLF